MRRNFLGRKHRKKQGNLSGIQNRYIARSQVGLKFSKVIKLLFQFLILSVRKKKKLKTFTYIRNIIQLKFIMIEVLCLQVFFFCKLHYVTIIYNNNKSILNHVQTLVKKYANISSFLIVLRFIKIVHPSRIIKIYI